MDMENLMQKFNADNDSRKQAIFANIFVMQNKLQTVCDKLDPEITMKQWLLLAVAETTGEELTLTKLGELMGCSRQNVKKLAVALEKKGFIEIVQNEKDARSTCFLVKNKMKMYSEKVGQIQSRVLELMFSDFTETEVEQLFLSMMKLGNGIERIKKDVQVKLNK